ncbi:MAG: bifunctional 4-hydroxy-2-oxoglutarate aldolase/2-dehydro-3-deoxy-phosphogluconate aldolase [Luteimonas sp.]|nr:bifunctional 4-hydroxy-2-oxoglutarate aldolase/2-dehydro-3-deoxy-phosphogluconate aldolase [Luteimonas sp.]
MTIETLQTRAEQALRAAGVMPVLTVDSVDQGLRMVDALAEGGLTTLELTLRTPAAMPALTAIKKARPDILVGAGTILSVEQAQASLDVGADFLVTPGTPPALAEALAKMPIPVVPGAATPTEFVALMALGFRVCKLFPTNAVGGLAMVRGLAGPFPELRLCANGGIGETTAGDYLAEPNVVCVGGSWMLPKAWLAAGEWDKVRDSAAKAAAIAACAREAG